ncbi:hypothetical protein MNBD_ALPHA12-223 [hydrothermal vent metagenome]|uniref:DUF6456 domain-containing protein n=1 Tax=hydrothermal vent metagenome TaxID=652676 RepID=A0A3B0TGF8_9ZZZZ
MTGARQKRFIRALLSGAVATANGAGLYRCNIGAHRHSLGEDRVEKLVSDGVLKLVQGKCLPTPLAGNWLKRQLAETGEIACQHGDIVPGANQTFINVGESVVATLAVSRNGSAPFLQAHHVQSAERLRSLVERSQMIQRTTMSYDPTRTPGGGTGGGAGFDLNSAALDARRELRRVLEPLPPDCAGVVIDVCGFLKGLQTVEFERKWPRRSAKLVLRIGLDQLALGFKLSPFATGAKSGRVRNWLGDGARPQKLE